MLKKEARKIKKSRDGDFAGENKVKSERDFCRLVRSMFERSPSAIFLENLDGKIIDCNKTACRMLGYKKGELLKLNANKIVPKGDAKKIFPKLIKDLLDKGSAMIEARNIRKDGTIFPVEVFFRLTRRSGQPVVFLTVRDISHHEEVEKQIKAEKEKTELYLNIAGVMIVAIDKAGKIILINRKGNKILGYKSGELLGKDWFTACLPAKDRVEVRKVFEKCVSGDLKFTEHHENYVITKAGEKKLIFWRNSVLKDRDGKIIGSLSSGEDITERKKIEEELARSRVLYTSLVENSNDGVVVLQDGLVKFFNNQMFNMVGYTEVEAYNKPFLNFIAEKDKKMVSAKYKSRIIGKKVSSRYEVELIKKGGKSFPAEINSSLIFFENRPAVMSIIRDMTKAKEVDKMKSEFVSVASHQLRTPLTGIKWFSELLLKNKTEVLSKKQKDYAEQISAAAVRMVNLVDDLLDVSRIETGEKYNVVLKKEDIAAVIKEAAAEKNLSARNKEISLEFSKDCLKETAVLADRNKMSQVFINLLDNAIKYTPRGGKIIVSREAADGEIIYSVKDNGVGIPARQTNRVFEKFFRAENASVMHTDGTGLGLYIVKAIIEAHQGRVWFETVENKGTTFFIALPLAGIKENRAVESPA